MILGWLLLDLLSISFSKAGITSIIRFIFAHASVIYYLNFNLNATFLIQFCKY